MPFYAFSIGKSCGNAGQAEFRGSQLWTVFRRRSQRLLASRDEFHGWGSKQTKATGMIECTSPHPPRGKRAGDKQTKLNMSKKYNDYLKTDYWKAVSDAVKRRAGYRCQLCNSQHDLCAHHRTYEHRGSELENLDDLVCLCRRCHEIFHGRVKEPPKLISTTKNSALPKRLFVVGDIDNLESEMPEGDSITLTEELIARCRTNGAFTSATVRAFGLMPGYETKGWPMRLIGKVLTRDQYREAIRGKHLYVRPPSIRVSPPPSENTPPQN